MAKDITELQDGPDHVAIIMDGNGRWATQRGRPRLFGHHAGARQPPGKAASGKEVFRDVASGASLEVDADRQRENHIGGDDRPIER